MASTSSERISSVRRFNRLYTRSIGLLPEGHLDSSYSLVEARVLYEIAHRDRPLASAIAADLHLDLGYMSRILSRFESHGLIRKVRSPSDRRQVLLSLTRKGKTTFSGLDKRANADVAALLKKLSRSEQVRLTQAMSVIENVLAPSESAGEASSVTLRAPEAGDLGWVIQRHGEIYAAEYGWTVEFEWLVLRIVADYVTDFEPEKERCWIALHNRERVGCVFLVKKSETVAKLRLLLVEPDARGLGIGRRLVAECTDFARSAGYRKIILWTQSKLDAARHLYTEAGYRVIARESHHSFGEDLTAETWELKL
jgi:DNA-binding MarR family transcriptional regulator/GNAT superfamily N-acetyltransferase